MSQALDHPGTHRARAEQAAMDNLIQRLTGQFPEVPHDKIVNAVRDDYQTYADSKVRDFVPILVERSVRRDLLSATPSGPPQAISL